MFILDRKEAVIVITSSSFFRCHIFRVDSILAAIPRRPSRPMPLWEHFRLRLLFSCELCGVDMKSLELFLSTLPLINEFLALGPALTSLFLAAGTCVGRGRRGDVQGLLAQGLGTVRRGRHQGK